MSNTEAGFSGGLAAFSGELSKAVAKAAASVVRVDDGTRLTASGVVFSADGVIVTTSHGVERDEELSVVTADGTRHAATLVGRDPDTDLAVAKIEATGLQQIATAEGGVPTVGQIALAVARPGEYGLTATLGLVSNVQETETDGAPEYILSTDAVLYPGFSGGALVNAKGELLGLLNRLYGRGMGVALGTPLLARVVEQIKAHGSVKRGYLGVRTQLVPLPEALRAALNVAQQHALLVLSVEPGSPAERAGLLLGDTLLEVNGKAVEDVGELKRHLLAGKPVAVTIARGGARQELTATLADKS